MHQNTAKEKLAELAQKHKARSPRRPTTNLLNSWTHGHRVRCKERTRNGKWHERIESDPLILRGKPCIKGTRIPVALILGYLAAGRTRS
jgi:hypothetical protein